MGKQQQEEESWAFPSRTFSPNAAFCHRGLPPKIPRAYELGKVTVYPGPFAARPLPAPPGCSEREPGSWGAKAGDERLH